MMKIAINRCFGGFELSKKAIKLYKEKTGEEPEWKFDGGTNRDDPALISVIEELGQEASNDRSEIIVVEIPDDVKWFVDDYDGTEWVSEEHR